MFGTILNIYKGSAWAPAFAGAHASGRAGQHFDKLSDLACIEL